jgi:hypothetical protein
MIRTRPAPVRLRGGTGVDLVVVAAVAAVYVVCLVNVVIGVVATNGLDGPTVESLERRYGDLKRHLDGVARVAYVSDDGTYFLGARYALVPTILDIRYVELRPDSLSVVGFDHEAIVEDALLEPGLKVVCEFKRPIGLAAFEDELSLAAKVRGLEVARMYRSGGLGLLAVGD